MGKRNKRHHPKSQNKHKPQRKKSNNPHYQQSFKKPTSSWASFLAESDPQEVFDIANEVIGSKYFISDENYVPENE